MNYFETHPFFQKFTKTCEKISKKLFKDHFKLEKTLQDQVDVSPDESTQTCKACGTLKEKESKLCLENEIIAKEKSTKELSRLVKQTERSSKGSDRA